MNRPLILIVGPSGSGKTLLVENIKKEHPYLKDVESYTTRPPRYEGERGHVFITQEEFDKLDLIARTHFHGYDYGVDKKTADEADLYVIDKAGVEAIRQNKYDKTRPIFVLGLSLSEDECRHRLIARGDSPEKVISRLENDKRMFEGYEGYCDTLVNASQSPEKVLADSLMVIGPILAKEKRK